MLIAMWLGDADDPAGAQMVERLNAVGQPAARAMTVMPFAAGVQRVIDEEFEDHHRYYTKEAHLTELAGEAIDRLVAFWKEIPMQGEIEIIGLGGAIDDVPGGRHGVLQPPLPAVAELRDAAGTIRPATSSRLGRIKARYDPDNFFQVNYNISPLPEAAGAR
jgi:hypothetical protein